MYAAFARSRIVVSRLFAASVLLVICFTTHSFSQEGLLDIGMEVSGLFLLSIASLGRLWALLYISGNKSQAVITEGPYSVVRHPLYVFSFIGAVGIGLASENVLVLALILSFYLLYYPMTIAAEEEKLSGRFGPAYVDYMRRVPRFIPKLSLYREPHLYSVKTAQFVRNFGDAMWFVWIFILLHFVENLQASGVLPVLWRVP
jgi:protein-S-isoprenylcysteine O-methyltransferase Ste14